MGKISNYARVLAAKLQDVFVCDQTDSNVTTTKSVTVEQIGDAICGEQVHATLETEQQTIIDGINEVNDKADTNAANIGSLSQLTTTDKSSLVGAVNEVNTGLANTYTKSEIDGISSAVINSTYATGNLYFKRIGKMVIVFGMITLTANVITNNQIFSGLPLNNNGGNNVIKAINNDGTSPDWVIYCPNNNNVYLSASSQSSGKSYTISFAYYVNA